MRLVTALALASVFVLPAFAQQNEDAPHFRFGFTGDLKLATNPIDDNDDEDGEVIVTPDPDNDDEDNETPEISELTYDIARPAYGGSVSVSPTWAAGMQGYGYSLYSDENPYAQLNEETGVVTWSGDFQGSQSVEIYGYSDEEGWYGAVGVSIAEVPRDYEIEFVPGDVTMQWGKLGTTLQFEATTVPAQPTAGENWEFIHVGDPWMDEVTYAGNRLTFDADAMLRTLALEEGVYEFKAVRTAGGVRVYSEPLKIDVTEMPRIEYRTSTGANYVVDGNGMSAIVQVLNGEYVEIPAHHVNGASGVASDVPFALPQMGRGNLPPGLSFGPDGSISGTVNADEWVKYRDIVVPAVNAAGDTFGFSFLEIAVNGGDRFQDWNDYHWSDRPDRNNPDDDLRTGTDPFAPEEEWHPTIYRVAAVAWADNWEDNWLMTSYQFGFERLGYNVLLETLDMNEAIAFLATQQHTVAFTAVFESNDPNLPMEQWEQPAWYNVGPAHHPYAVAFGRHATSNITGDPACPPARYVLERQFATEEWARQFIDHMRAEGLRDTVSLSVLHLADYAGTQRTVVHCEPAVR